MKTKQVNTYCQTLVIFPPCSAIIRPFAGCVGMLYMHEETATAPAKGKGILFQSITKSDLKIVITAYNSRYYEVLKK